MTRVAPPNEVLAGLTQKLLGMNAKQHTVEKGPVEKP